VTFDNVFEAAMYILTTIASVTALAIALFGPATALERWLDDPLPSRSDGSRHGSVPHPAPPLHDPDVHAQAA